MKRTGSSNGPLMRRGANLSAITYGVQLLLRCLKPPLNGASETENTQDRLYQQMKRNTDKLEAGRGLDTLVAQNVMGWRSVQRLGKGGKRNQYRGKKPDKLSR